jgi:8-amino-7-oxononanoate synthase
MDVTLRVRRGLAALAAEDALRRSPEIRARRGVEYELAGRRVVGFCSNDYLGLADHRLPQADAPAPNGSGASRLIAGDLQAHRDLEAELAAWLRSEDAVLFPSGFQLNVGVLPALLEAGDRVDSDALNHASIIDGLRLSRARIHVLPHGRAPTPAASLDDDGVHWWITESLFSMDGDRLDLTAAEAHTRRGGALYVDEAHALGLFEHGLGLAGALPMAPTVTVGTLSKAVGVAGAFVAASAPICAWLRNRSRSFVFSTGVSPLVVAALRDAVALVRSARGDALRADLWRNAEAMARAFDAAAPPSPIFPLLVGDNADALRVAADLLDRGWHVQAIRPPTVPVGTARLRITVSAGHSLDHVEALAADVRDVFARRDLPIRLERGRLDPLTA